MLTIVNILNCEQKYRELPMKKLLFLTGLLTTLSFSILANQQVIDKIKLKIQNMSGIQITSVTKSKVSGFYEVLTPRALFYVSADGHYLIQGSIFDLDDDLNNLTEEKMATVRKDKLEDYTDSMIVFTAKNPEHSITVFTDVDCGYCQKLHSKMQKYNDLGITVRYLAFPRGGPKAPAWNKMESLWCSEDKHQAMNNLKLGGTIPSLNCKNKVADHFKLGLEFGLSGTPAIVLDNGTLMPGYHDPEKLIKALKAS